MNSDLQGPFSCLGLPLCTESSSLTAAGAVHGALLGSGTLREPLPRLCVGLLAQEGRGSCRAQEGGVQVGGVQGNMSRRTCDELHPLDYPVEGGETSS